LEPETNPPVSGAPPPAVDPERWVEKYGDQLFGFVAARIRDHAIAQNLVQETFLAAIKAKDGFAGRALKFTGSETNEKTNEKYSRSPHDSAQAFPPTTMRNRRQVTRQVSQAMDTNFRGIKDWRFEFTCSTAFERTIRGRPRFHLPVTAQRWS